jgi:hypothetical protein
MLIGADIADRYGSVQITGLDKRENCGSCRCGGKTVWQEQKKDSS